VFPSLIFAPPQQWYQSNQGTCQEIASARISAAAFYLGVVKEVIGLPARQFYLITRWRSETRVSIFPTFYLTTTPLYHILCENKTANLTKFLAW